MTITASADGSALGNPGPAGWAWYVDDDNWAAGGWKHATNNQGELTAVLELFRATEHARDDLLILCDSQYVINSVTKWMPGWKKKGWRKGDGKPVMNVELLKQIDDAIAGRTYRFEWVRGHVGHVLNEAADARARAAAEAYRRDSTVLSGPGWTGGGGHSVTTSPAPASRVKLAEPGKPAEPVKTPTHSSTPATLFDFEMPGAHELTLSLTGPEFTRVQQRARDAGVTIEEWLRSLI